MAELFDDFLVEIRKNVLREKQSGKTKYIFVPEKSATWYNIKMSSMPMHVMTIVAALALLTVAFVMSYKKKSKSLKTKGEK